MRLGEEGIRSLVSAALLVFLVTVGAYLWFIDLLSHQSEFGIFLAAELVAFSMLLYLQVKTSYDEVKKAWFLIGCVSLVFFLTLALLN
jgi:hypothetical protein